MESLDALLEQINGIIWGPLMLLALFGTGVYLSLGLRLLPVRRIAAGFRFMVRGMAHDKQRGAGDITPFQALSVAISGQIGTGNIAGVATALTLGGPGAIFWMWVTALVGMATTFCEAVLAVHFRERDIEGRHVGGPMYYIRNGLGPRWHWLAFLFALFTTFAAFGIGNTVQSNSLAHAIDESLHLPTWVTGLGLSALIFTVVIGGVRRIGEWAERLVPLMGAVYLFSGVIILFLHAGQVPAALSSIFAAAFTGEAAGGGAVGGGLWLAIRFGVARGVFSNEAGLGSTPIAHAAAKTQSPITQGLIGMLGTFFDTLVVCTITALVILVTGSMASGETGAALSTIAFAEGLPGFGHFVVTFGLVIFAFTTILAWSYYGERAVEFLFGIKAIPLYRAIWIILIFIGAVASLETVWLLADIMNGLMALPNLFALLLLSPIVFTLTRTFFRQQP